MFEWAKRLSVKYGSLSSVVFVVILFVYLGATPSKSNGAKGSKKKCADFCGKAINCLDIGGESSTLIAAGGSDPIIRIWDPRKPGKYDPIFQLSGHNSWISSCKWHNKSWFHLVSASYDGKVMIWDLRAAFPLHVNDSHKNKVLCADCGVIKQRNHCIGFSNKLGVAVFLV
ncbi:unnamed protein product [Fraxinus pennsylvanica]|uniref:Uncharacterized protein n=1 Tax=Fraxinus pennsylvanica TaxID=56036 RepID=A0AAD2A6F8_9LAMI|nr:unnamed protein product [Fraxinus pennsylvanica]